MAGERPRIGRGKRANHGGRDGDHSPERAPLPGTLGAEEIRQNDEDAAKADNHRRPAEDMHLLAKKNRRENHRHQRGGVADRGRVGDRQQHQGAKTQRHRGAADERADDVAAKAFGAEDIDDRAAGVIAPGHPREHGDEREERAEEHDLAERIPGAGQLDERGHAGERKRRGDLERDAEERLRRMLRGHGRD